LSKGLYDVPCLTLLPS